MTKLVVTSVLLGLALSSQAGLLTNEGFEEGPVTGNAAFNGATVLTNAPVDTWVARATDWTGAQRADTGFATQTGSAAIIFQQNQFNAAYQMIDVTSLGNLSNETVSVFADFGRHTATSGSGLNGSQFRLIGFNDPSTVTVDLGNNVNGFSGTGFTELYSYTRGFGQLSEDKFTTYGADIVLTNDYEYFAVLVGGNAKANDTGNFVAVDNVQFNISGVTPPVTPVVAGDSAISVGKNLSRAFKLTASGGEGSLAYTVLSGPTNGVISGTSPNLTYTPNQDYLGEDSLTFEATDGVTTSAVATVTFSVVVPPQLGEFLVNGSFETGSTNFIFSNDPLDIPLTTSMIGKWLSREPHEDNSMDLADISSSVSGQDGSISMMFQSGDKRGLVQVIDTSLLDISGLSLDFSASFAAPGRETNSSPDIATYHVIGFDSFTGVTADIGGRYIFTGGVDVVAKHTIADADLSGSAYTEFNETATLAQDYNYLAVLVGGLAGAVNSDTQYVAVDNVQLIINSTDLWQNWLAAYPALGTQTNLTDDVEPDGMNNLLEYALGSDPTANDAVDFLPTSTVGEEGGTTFLNYVYRRSIEDIGVTYSVGSGTDLVFGNITNATEQVGTSGDLGDGFESVTNRVPVDTETKKFMQLKVQKN